MKNQSVKCDVCGEEFGIEIQEEEVNKELSRVFLKCPHCDQEYTVHYTSDVIKKKQKEIREIAAQIQKQRGKRNFDKIDKLNKKYLKLKEELKKDMNELEGLNKEE